jgi:uncharacterized membrane protein
VVVLALIVAVLGPAVTAVPLGGLWLVVGELLLIFGVQWSCMARHDEDAIYAAELTATRTTV